MSSKSKPHPYDLLSEYLHGLFPRITRKTIGPHLELLEIDELRGVKRKEMTPLQSKIEFSTWAAFQAADNIRWALERANRGESVIMNRFKISKNTVYLNGFPFEFRIEDFVKMYSPYLTREEMRRILYSFYVKKNTVDSVLKKYKDDFKLTKYVAIENQIREYLSKHGGHTVSEVASELNIAENELKSLISRKGKPRWLVYHLGLNKIWYFMESPDLLIEDHLRSFLKKCPGQKCTLSEAAEELKISEQMLESLIRYEVKPPWIRYHPRYHMLWYDPRPERPSNGLKEYGQPG